MEFLYPRPSIFPFDGVCAEIIKKLEEKGFNFPGIEVEFCEYNIESVGDFRRVTKISGENFQIEFYREQGMLDENCPLMTGVSKITIPGSEIVIPSNNTQQMHFFLYIGKDWEADKKAFFGDKNDCQKRIYAKYLVAWTIPPIQFFPNRRPKYLLWTDDGVKFKIRWWWPFRKLNEPAELDFPVVERIFMTYLQKILDNLNKA